eukprot:SAG11_NODE_629_length_8073_cov_6.782042_2_plen_96_part_00
MRQRSGAGGPRLAATRRAVGYGHMHQPGSRDPPCLTARGGGGGGARSGVGAGAAGGGRGGGPAPGARGAGGVGGGGGGGGGDLSSAAIRACIAAF